MRLKKALGLVLVIAGTLGIAYFFMPKYLQRAFTYFTANIDDYEIFDNRTVAAGEGHAWKEDKEYNKKTLSQKARKDLENYETVAFLVVKDKKILYEEYWDGYDKESLSGSFSMAKSIVGLLIGIAIDDGHIKSLDQPVGDFLEEFNKGDKSKITIKHMLTMSDGLEWDESYLNPMSPTTKIYYGDDLAGVVMSLDVEKEPGKEWRYSSGTTQILGFLLEQATGKTLSDLASEKLWKPMGAEHDALWSLDKEGGMEKAFCCFNSNARDFARFGQLILSNGKWKGKNLIDKDYLKEMTSPADYLIDEEGEDVDFYGYQWWIMHYNGMTIPYMRGLMGQYVFAIPTHNAVVVRLGHDNIPDLTDNHMTDSFYWIDAAMEIIK